MATLHVSFCSAVQYGVANDPSAYEAVTTSGTNAATTNNPGAPIAFLFSDAAHFVNIGAAATSSNGFYLPANTLVPFALDNGEEINAITA